MACLGVHFAITKDMADKLLHAKNDEELIEIVQEEIEEKWDKENLCETDKAWDAIHRCLSDGSLRSQPRAYLLGDVLRFSIGKISRLRNCIFGGKILNRKNDYFVVLLMPSQVRETAEELSKVTREWLRDRYFKLKFLNCPWEKSEQDWEWFKGLPAFFQKAAKDGRYVIFAVDQ
jgi:hypothetical protein